MKTISSAIGNGCFVVMMWAGFSWASVGNSVYLWIVPVGRAVHIMLNMSLWAIMGKFVLLAALGAAISPQKW